MDVYQFRPDRRDLLLDPLEQRERLIQFLDYLVTKDHIRMKNVMRYYRDLLRDGKSLKDRHFKQLIPYLRKYSTLTVDDCWCIHRSLCCPYEFEPDSNPPADLTRFFE